MAANNEIGCINDIKKIGMVAHRYKIPFHTDATQVFGKYKIPLVKNNIDVLSMSFHKLHGPLGLGLLVIRNDLVDGYGLREQISEASKGGCVVEQKIYQQLPHLQRLSIMFSKIEWRKINTSCEKKTDNS